MRSAYFFKCRIKLASAYLENSLCLLVMDKFCWSGGCVSTIVYIVMASLYHEWQTAANKYSKLAIMRTLSLYDHRPSLYEMSSTVNAGP